MKSNQRKVRLAISGVLLAAVVATGIYAYNQDHAKGNRQARQEEVKDRPFGSSRSSFRRDVNTSNADADMPKKRLRRQPQRSTGITEAPEPTEHRLKHCPGTGRNCYRYSPSELSFNENTVLTAPISGIIRRSPDTLQHGQHSVFPHSGCL